MSRTLVTVVGNPRAGSRTLTAATTLTDALADRLSAGDGGFDPVVAVPIDLAVIADGLLAPWRLSTAAADAVERASSAAIPVVATPTYKAGFTGLLKLFLDTLPAGSLAGTVVVPLTVAGGPAHRDLTDLAAPTDTYVDRYAPILTAAARLLRPLTTSRH